MTQHRYPPHNTRRQTISRLTRIHQPACRTTHTRVEPGRHIDHQISRLLRHHTHRTRRINRHHHRIRLDSTRKRIVHRRRHRLRRTTRPHPHPPRPRRIHRRHIQRHTHHTRLRNTLMTQHRYPQRYAGGESSRWFWRRVPVGEHRDDLATQPKRKLGIASGGEVHAVGREPSVRRGVVTGRLPIEHDHLAPARGGGADRRVRGRIARRRLALGHVDPCDQADLAGPQLGHHSIDPRCHR